MWSSAATISQRWFSTIVQQLAACLCLIKSVFSVGKYGMWAMPATSRFPLSEGYQINSKFAYFWCGMWLGTGSCISERFREAMRTTCRGCSTLQPRDEDVWRTSVPQTIHSGTVPKRNVLQLRAARRMKRHGARRPPGSSCWISQYCARFGCGRFPEKTIKTREFWLHWRAGVYDGGDGF
jgi:hypothetical protein